MYGTKYFDENFLGKSQIMGNAQYYNIRIVSFENRAFLFPPRFPASTATGEPTLTDGPTLTVVPV
jgi:hypothetical protein